MSLGFMHLTSGESNVIFKSLLKESPVGTTRTLLFVSRDDSGDASSPTECASAAPDAGPVEVDALFGELSFHVPAAGRAV